MAASITLHKFGLYPDDEDNHVFSFVFENPQKIHEVKSVESTEVTYGGHKWSIVCMRKEERYMGIFLKWKYTDGQSASSVSCRAKYVLTLIHRQDFRENKYFHSTQKFSSSQSLLGKSKFIPISDLCDLSAGFLDETGKRAILELSLSRASTRCEKRVDTSPGARTRKNASGYYFDTSTFLLSNHRWYLRVYTNKSNSNGLPAVYLYLSSKPRGVSMEVQFNLYLGQDTTEILTYHFGEGAKFDGFGKTLPEPLYNVEKITEIVIGVEVTSIVTYKTVPLRLKGSGGLYTPHLYNRDISSPYRGGNSTYGGLTATEAFQDHEGNYWKADLVRDAKNLTMTFDKGVHHYPHNKTKLLCWSATLLALDPHRAQDVDMGREAMTGYFSNFIDDKGYLMPFPLEMPEVEEKGNPYVDENGEMYFRVNLISLQTIPIGMRSIPRFDFQVRHLLKARQELKENQRSLEDMRDMSASRASLSMLDISGRDDRLSSEGGDSTGGKMQLFKSCDSLDALSTGDMITEGDDYGKIFFTDVLKYISSMKVQNGLPLDEASYVTTSRDTFHGTREDVSTESGVTVSDETSLLIDARPSPVDMGKQKEIANLLVKLLQQRLPVRVTEVLEFGSLGTGTTTRSRMDIDFILFSPDFPKEGQAKWVAALLHAVKSFFLTSSIHPDPFFPIPKCKDFHLTPYALQFNCGGLDVDVMLSHDWDAEAAGGFDQLYEASCKQTTPRGRQWMALATARLQKKFLAEQPNEVKEIVKVVKHWRNCVQWKKAAYRPNSYLLALLVIKAIDILRSFDIKRVLQKVGSFVMAPELSLTWTSYYLAEKYPVEFEPPTPLVRDPANPGCNVAESLPYWGQFRAEYSMWMKGLNLIVSPMATPKSSEREDGEDVDDFAYLEQLCGIHVNNNNDEKATIKK